jgi:hypothetical protein
LGEERLLDNHRRVPIEIKQTNGVNFESKIKALCSIFPVSQIPEFVIFHETSCDRMTEGKSTNSVSIPYPYLPALLNTLRQISREEFDPAIEDATKPSMVLFTSRINEHHLNIETFKLTVQLVSVIGMSGAKRMVRLSLHYAKPPNKLVQFPWHHLPRLIHQWTRLQQDVQDQVAEIKSSPPTRQ